MGLKNYGVLRGRVTGARREDDQDTPHYQIRVAGAGVDYRIAVNVKSQLSPSELLFLVIEDFRHPITEKLTPWPRASRSCPRSRARLPSISSAATCSTGSTCASCRRACQGRTTT